MLKFDDYAPQSEWGKRFFDDGLRKGHTEGRRQTLLLEQTRLRRAFDVAVIPAHGDSLPKNLDVLLCLNATTGESIWSQSIKLTPEESDSGGASLCRRAVSPPRSWDEFHPASARSPVFPSDRYGDAAKTSACKCGGQTS